MKFLLVTLSISIVVCVAVIKTSQENEVEDIRRLSSGTVGKYIPDWKSLDSRPLPEWYDKAKVGIFLHWGVFSVPSFGSEWFWFNWKGMHLKKYTDFMKENYPPGFTYAEFAPKFTAEFFDPVEWVDIFKASGARYIVLTSKHHEGYTLWPSKHSFNWNSVDVGPKRDLIGDLAAAVRNHSDIHFGLYHSLFEWFNPLFLSDKKNNFTTQEFVLQKSLPELYELVDVYKPDVIWSDGDWSVEDGYWKSKEFLAWLFNSSPVRDTVVVNDRWGKGDGCKHGSFYSCADRFNPGTLQTHKWENCMTIDKSSWGYRRNAKFSDYMSIENLLKELAETVSCGGNLLMNVGPTSDGRIAPIFEERLRQMGTWLKINGEAIYESKPWKYQNDTVTTGVWYTTKKNHNGQSVYAIVLKWPQDSILQLGSVSPVKTMKIKMLGYEGPNLSTKPAGDGITVNFPPMFQVSSQWSWVLKITGI